MKAILQRITGKQEWYHVIKLVQRLLIILLVYTLLRVIFIIRYEAELGSPDINEILSIFRGGLLFDISAIVYSNALFILLHIIPFSFRFNRWYQVALKIIFYISNGILFLFSAGDLGYFAFTLKRTTIDFFGMTGDFMDQAVSYLVGYWYLLLLLAVLFAAIEWLYRKTTYTIRQKQFFIVQFLIMVLCGGLWVLGARGGLQVRPISPITAVEYASANGCPAVTNTPFMLMYSFTKKRLPEAKYFSDGECKNIFTLYKTGNYTEPPLKKNVVVIILESFSREYFYSFNPARKGLAPFLDSLMHEGYYAENGFANAKHSNEGVPAIIGSLPALMDESFINSVYADNRITGIGGMMKQQGYKTDFFHGATNGSFNFVSFSRACGFDHYYGRTEFNNEKEFDGQWGIWDEPFFDYFKAHLDTIPQPFCEAIFSLTSHFPYPVPEKYKGRFGGDKDEDPMFKCLRYTDFVLRKFFTEASKQPWFKNTLFVISADHTSESSSNTANRFSTFRIPIFFYDPGTGLKGSVSQPVCQVDIMPSIADYLRLPGTVASFGSSIFSPGTKRYACQYLGGIYQVIGDKYYLEFDGTKTIGIYNYLKDPILANNLLNNNILEREDMENYLKALIQSYNGAMNKDLLSPK